MIRVPCGRTTSPRRIRKLPTRSHGSECPGFDKISVEGLEIEEPAIPTACWPMAGYLFVF
ncbi:uncharacterized protein B0I36DRAFT_317833 [Microdochium trichocladiopsis]|uniref:Uncharacterized protein n=1 Tax=Microdochium trichocladiopsis TaxID=1682393 RepID=A0A9P8YBF9_9PEZI|nr:uncharacterized protein B0I36DRAFT_317833 [Microdochium trichocladiopsis]KAH7035197.1 hypothetical protein B0I36DRAFT_317833 [Microdochium trichocladiopsis]